MHFASALLIELLNPRTNPETCAESRRTYNIFRKQRLIITGSKKNLKPRQNNAKRIIMSFSCVEAKKSRL